MKQKALFVGPASFNQGTWDTRANYILPDLFSSLVESFDLFILTGEVPDFARPAMEQLCARFNIEHIELKEVELTGGRDFWEVAVEDCALRIRPHVISNSLGSLRLGKAIAAGAKRVGARSVLRVAGDEIGSRLAMGKYANANRRYVKDIQLEADGILGVDTVVVMSGLEKARLENIAGVDANKIKVCIRGVDVGSFSPPSMKARHGGVRRFLYVGRKSAEKGFDIIEAAAKAVYKTRPDIEFVFVGDFEQQVTENRHYLGWIHAQGLPDLYRSVDAFVLTSRTEGFPQVVAEAMASGLPCILSRHLFSVLFRHESDALLTGLSPDEVVQSILRLADDCELSARLAVRSREIAEQMLDCHLWQGRYLAVLQGNEINDESIFDTGAMAQERLPDPAQRPRVAFISPRVFGLMGTQGSYGLAGAFSRHCPILIITKAAAEARDIPVVTGNEGLPDHVALNFDSGVGERILELFAAFRPDIVHFVNDHCWVDLLPLLKARYPDARYVLDLKTPLLVDGEKRLSLQGKGRTAARSLDLVVSLSREIVNTWIPGYSGRVICYPLGIDTGKIPRRDSSAISGKMRCVYVGQTHPKRQLPVLLELIASLDEGTKNALTVDIIGAGGGEAEIDDCIVRLKLQGIVHRKEAVSQDELFRLLPGYDCGLAWVPPEVYGFAPSLKFLEYAAAGLRILATNTPAHQLNVDAGFSAFLFEIDPESFRTALRKSLEADFCGTFQQNNFKIVRQFDFDHVVEHFLLPEYIRLRERRLRMLFITPRVLGLLATPGTYLSVEAYAEHCDLHVIAKPRTSDDEYIVHVTRKDISVSLLDPKDTNYYEQVREVCTRFSPDIVCIGLWPKWNAIAVALRQDFPDVALALEVKSPAMGKKGERIYDRDCKCWQSDHYVLDGIIAPAKGMVNTFIENVERPFLQHRSIISYESIKKKTPPEGLLRCRNFVFSGSLAKRRQIDKLIYMISQLPQNLLEQIHIDFFGDGPARGELERLSATLGLSSKISFLGAIPQSHLFNRYCDYDAGIAWVPKDIYDSAPSLKLIEYCASGIAPIATSSSGHLLLEKFGFAVDYFDEQDQQSFTDAMFALVEDGVDSARIAANTQKARDFDYRSVVNNEILPFYTRIILDRKNGQNERDGAGAPGERRFDPFRGWVLQTLGDLETGMAGSTSGDAFAKERHLHAKRMRTMVSRFIDGYK